MSEDRHVAFDTELCAKNPEAAADRIAELESSLERLEAFEKAVLPRVLAYLEGSDPRAAETFLEASRLARKLAADYRVESQETTDDHRRAVCEWEAEQADERSAWYSARAALFTPKQKHRKAA